MPQPTNVKLEITLMDDGTLHIAGNMNSPYEGVGLCQCAMEWLKGARPGPQPAPPGQLILPNGPQTVANLRG